MAVELEEKYTPAGVRRTLRDTTIYMGANLGLSFLAYMAFMLAPQNLKGPFGGGFLIAAVACCAIGITAAGLFAEDIAKELDNTHTLAQKLDVRSDLFFRFKPAQERIDRELAVLAHRFSLACKAQAEFYQANPGYLGDNAEGARISFDAVLTNREGYLKDDVKEAKGRFWDLYDALKSQGFELRKGWKEYLTHAGVGPDDPEVLALRHGLPPEWAQPVEGANELPGQ